MKNRKTTGKRHPRRARSADPMSRLVNWVYYLLGSVLYALSVDIFATPNHLVPGGVTGLSVLIHTLVPAFPIGAGILVINLPLLVAARIRVGRGFALRTAAVTALSSLTIDLLEPFLPTYTADPLLAALFGGVLAGAGIGLVFLRGATTGGSEIVARLLEKRFPHISMGRFLLLVDGLIILASAFVFKSAETIMYAAVLVFVTSLVMDELIGGANRTRAVLVISEQKDFGKLLTDKLERGVTVWTVTGAYTGQERQMFLCAVRPSEVYPLRLLADTADPRAFMIVLSSEQVLGEGFRAIHPE